MTRAELQVIKENTAAVLALTAALQGRPLQVMPPAEVEADVVVERARRRLVAQQQKLQKATSRCR